MSIEHPNSADHGTSSPDDVDIEVEEYQVKGSQLGGRVKELLKEGRARRVIIKKGDKVLFNIPLTGGIGGTAAAIYLLPQIAAVGLAAALFTGVRVIVERVPENQD